MIAPPQRDAVQFHLQASRSETGNQQFIISKLLAGPQTYRLPINDQNCANDCTCGVGLRVLEAAKIDEQTSSRFKEWKRLRAQLEAKAELQTSDRSEICAEGLTWVCKSELLSALKAQE